MYNPDTVIKTIHVDSQEKSVDGYSTLPVSVNYVTPAPVLDQVTVLEDQDHLRSTRPDHIGWAIF